MTTDTMTDERVVERIGAYVASRASIPERGAMWRQFRDEGCQINSTWIDEDGDGQTDDFSELWLRISSEVQHSERLILYAEPEDFPLKGALIEVGMALGFGVPVLVVAPFVRLEPRSCRPLGSWINHPLVRRIDTVEQALLIKLEALGLTPPHDPGSPVLSPEEGEVSVTRNCFELSREEVDALVIAELQRRHPEALPISIDYEPRTNGGFCHCWWATSAPCKCVKTTSTSAYAMVARGFALDSSKCPIHRPDDPGSTQEK